MNKKAKTSPLMIVLVLGVLAIAGFIGYSMYSGSQIEQQQIKIAAQDCELTPTLSLTAIDAINPGTSVSAGMKAIVNGAYKGTVTSSTSFSAGDKVELLLNATNYIGTTLSPITMGCGVNSINAQLYKLDGVPTFKVYGEAGDQLTDSATGGATNESSSSTPITEEIKLTTPSDEAIEGMVIVIEASNTTQVNDMVLSSESATVEKISRPEVYSTQSSANNELVKSFRVTNIADDGATTTFNLNIEPESGKTIDETTIYITFYPEDSFVDTDGTFKIGIENSDGTAKYVDAADGDYDFMIT